MQCISRAAWWLRCPSRPPTAIVPRAEGAQSTRSPVPFWGNLTYAQNVPHDCSWPFYRSLASMQVSQHKRQTQFAGYNSGAESLDSLQKEGFPKNHAWCASTHASQSINIGWQLHLCGCAHSLASATTVPDSLNHMGNEGSLDAGGVLEGPCCMWRVRPSYCT
eukprot:970523-Pelagomonas_calceolata.AAC.4